MNFRKLGTLLFTVAIVGACACGSQGGTAQPNKKHEPSTPPNPCAAGAQQNPGPACGSGNPSPQPTATPNPSPSPTPTVLPSSGHGEPVWVNDDVQNGGVAVLASTVQGAADIVENQLQFSTGKAFTDGDVNYTGGNIGSNTGSQVAYAGGHNPSWLIVIMHYQGNAMPAGSEVGSTCTGSNNFPFKEFYTEVKNNQNGLSESVSVFHVGSSAITTRINKGFHNPGLGCNGSSDNFLNNYGQSAVRAAAMQCPDTSVNDTPGGGLGQPFGPSQNPYNTFGCDAGFDTADRLMWDNNHVTVNKTCANCGWTSTFEGVSDDNYSGGAGKSGFCPANLCTAADLGPTLDHNHALMYAAAVHRDGVTLWSIFINQMQDGQISNNVTPRCTDLINGFNNGSSNVVLIQNEDGFEDTSNDETAMYNPWQYAFSLNSASCVLYNGVNSTTAYEVHQVDDYIQGCSAGGGGQGPNACPQSVIDNNRKTYLGLEWMFLEPNRTPYGEQVVNNGGHPLGTNDHYVLSSFPEFYIFPAGPLETMAMYSVPQTLAAPGQDGSGGSRLDTIADGGTVDLVVGALAGGGPQNSPYCGWSNKTIGTGDGTNTNKKVCMVARQYLHCYQYVATMAQALSRGGTWTDRGPCAAIVNIPMTTGPNNPNPNAANTGSVVPCNTSIGPLPFASGGVGDFTQYAHMMTFASYTVPGGFMGVATNDAGSNASGSFPGACSSSVQSNCSDANFTRANGPGDANVTGAAFVCYNGANLGSATVIPPGQGREVFQ